MDIKAKIEEIVEKIKNDKDIAAKFQADPVKTIEPLIGVDLPDDQVKAVVEGVKGKIDLDSLGEKAQGITGKIKDLFHKG